jgi:hypothetical protein
MRRAVALLSVALLGGCGGADRAAREGPPPGGQPWRAIAATLSGPEDPASANVCVRGDAGCVAEVAREMNRRLAPEAARCDHRAAFALMYLRVTEGVAREGRLLFHDPRYLNHLDAAFAELFFKASDTWARGRDAGVPSAWRIAFEAAQNREVAGLGDLLLGMNAHISRDLPYAVAAVGLRSQGGRSAKRDFDRVNELLGRIQEGILQEERRRLDPTITNVKLPSLEGGPADLGRLLGAWRSEAWRNAERLIAAATPAARTAVEASIDRVAADRARLIRTVTTYGVFGGSAKARREYCAQRGARGGA